MAGGARHQHHARARDGIAFEPKAQQQDDEREGFVEDGTADLLGIEEVQLLAIADELLERLLSVIR